MSGDGTSLRIATVRWQAAPGAWCLTVAAKATFALVPHQVVPIADAEPLHSADAFWNGNPSASLTAVAELTPLRARADVVVVGQAFAPGGAPVRSLVARLSVSPGIDKAVEICCDRLMRPDGSVIDGAPFVRMPLRYERAAGGAGTTNPVGMASSERDRFGHTPLPHLQPCGFAPSAGRFPEPIGLGPLAASWPERAHRMGGHAWPVEPARWAVEPMPPGLDPGCFNVAPADQQLDELDDGATLVLEHLHPTHATLITRLPGSRPEVVVQRRGRSERVRMGAALLWIDTDRALCTLTWLGSVALDSPAERLEANATLLSGGAAEHATARPAPPSRDAARPTPPAPRPSKPDGEHTMTYRLGEGGLPKPALPFRPVPSTSSPLPPAAQAAPPAAPDPSPPPPPVASRAPVAPWIRAAPAVPFSAPLEPPAPPAAAPAVAKPAPAPPAVPVAAPPAPPPLAPLAPAAGGAAHKAVGAMRIASPWIAGAPAHATGQHASPSPAAAAPAAPLPSAAVSQTPDALVLLWHDPDVASRLRRRAPWRTLLDRLQDRPPDVDLDEAEPGEQAADTEDRRAVFEVVAHATECGETEVFETLRSSVRPDGCFAPKLELVAGEITLGFDEIEALKATTSTATPLAAGDPELVAAIDAGAALLGAPGGAPSRELAARSTRRIREAFARAAQELPAGYLEDQCERTLLERRAYGHRDVLGAPHVRAELCFRGSTTPMVLYLPKPVAAKLPLYTRFGVRALVEVHFQADQQEAHPLALRAMAVARVVPGHGLARRG